MFLQIQHKLFFLHFGSGRTGAVPTLVISTPGSLSFIISVNESGCTILLLRVGVGLYSLNLSPLGGVYIGNWLKWRTTVVTAVVVSEFSSLRFLCFPERRRQRFPRCSCVFCSVARITNNTPKSSTSRNGKMHARNTPWRIADWVKPYFRNSRNRLPIFFYKECIFF